MPHERTRAAAGGRVGPWPWARARARAGQGRAEAEAVAWRGEARQAGRRAGVASLLPLKSTLSREFRSLMVEAN